MYPPETERLLLRIERMLSTLCKSKRLHHHTVLKPGLRSRVEKKWIWIRPMIKKKAWIRTRYLNNSAHPESDQGYFCSNGAGRGFSLGVGSAPYRSGSAGLLRRSFCAGQAAISSYVESALSLHHIYAIMPPFQARHVLSVQKFTANLYCICLSVPQIYA